MKTVLNLTKTLRENQKRPQTNKSTILYLCGRGFGKTFAGAANVIIHALSFSNQRIGIIAPTFSDLVKVCFYGESGMFNLLPEELIINYDKRFQTIDLYNGTRIEGFTAESYERLRGPQFHLAWIDELAGMGINQSALFEILEFSMRLGDNPQIIVTTTPKPTKLIKKLYEEAYLITGSTYENKAHLSKSFIKKLEDSYENTRIGKQEIYAEILSDIEGALWNYNLIDYSDINREDLKRIVIGVDPAITSAKESNETGIIVCGMGIDGLYYILEDGSIRGSPNEWAMRVINLYEKWQADRIVVEVNQGGDMVRSIISRIKPSIPITEVRATRGKLVRAEPIAALYEQRKVKHIKSFPTLEEQMTNYTGDLLEKSPDRLDALVWGMYNLMNKTPTVVNVSMI